jgi:CheY-like chemotaxis protein
MPDFTVLQIDDLASNLVLVERLLEYRPGIKVYSALSGPDGLDMALAHRPDLILLDLFMPGMAGDEVLTRLKADPRTSNIPVIVFSGSARDERVEAMLRSGAIDFLPKPFTVQSLFAAVDAVRNPLLKAAGVPVEEAKASVGSH